MAITLEFWRSDALSKIYTIYNGKNYSLSEFLRLPETGSIISAMYDKIVTDYPYQDTGEMAETVGKFILEHFMDLDKTFDVVILGEGDKRGVLFNLEDKPTYYG